MSASLHDREQDAADFVVFRLQMIERSLGSTMGHLHMLFDDFLISAGRRTDIQHHHDIRSQIALDVDDVFRSEHMFGAVIRRTEFHSLFGQFHLYLIFIFRILSGISLPKSKGKHLKASAIRKYELIPMFERMKPSRLFHQLIAGAQV